jgi:proteic killer suppression protein
MMEIESIRHKALKRLFLEGRTKGIIEPQRLIDMLAFIVAASDFDRLAEPPNFGFHPLTGDRKGCFAMTVTRNWRLTFTRIDDHSIAELDLEDYH